MLTWVVSVSSIDDPANGAAQTRPYSNSVEERWWVVRLVCSYAHDADDARQLCAALGLNPREGRKTRRQRSSVSGRPPIRASLSDTALGGRPAPPIRQNP